MTSIASELETLIDKYLLQMNALSNEEFLYKPLPSKWSKKEITGHLIDSAQNNIRRFIIAQYDENQAITYNQDSWVSINNYQQYDLPELIELWYLLNKQISNIWKNTPDEAMQRTCNFQTIEWLALDYIEHLQHHIHQVLNLDPVAYPKL